VSDNELGPRGERLVVLIDGLDEYALPAGALLGDPLAAFLPHALPRGVSFLCISRPRHRTYRVSKRATADSFRSNTRTALPCSASSGPAAAAHRDQPALLPTEIRVLRGTRCA
jgi:hypothetical protein